MTQKTSDSPYTSFYRVMLILSTIGTAFAVLNLISIPQAIADFSISPLYGGALLAQHVISLVTIVALVLLWKKRIEGFYLKIGSYVATIIAIVIGLFGLPQYIPTITKQIIDADSQFQGREEVIGTIINVGVYVGFGISIVIAIVFATLWAFAWKKQTAADK